MLRAALHTDAARVPAIGLCLRICTRMCFNIRKALSLIPRRPYATKSAAVRPPEHLEHRSGLPYSPAPPRPSEAILVRLSEILWGLLALESGSPARGCGP